MHYPSLACSLFMAGACCAQVSFEPLPGMFSAQGISADGSIIAGRATPEHGWGAARWVRGQGMQLLESLPGQTAGGSWETTPDGSVIIGTVVSGGQQQAARWTASGLQPLGGRNAYGITPDGRTIVGEGSATALMWQDGVMSTLAAPLGATITTAVDIADDRSSIVGFAALPGRWEGTRWVDGVPTLMGTMGINNGTEVSLPWECTPDGGVVVGYGTTSLGFEAFRWTEAGGMQPLGDLPGGSHFSVAYAVSDDGNVIGGSYNGLDTAFVWTATHGMRDFRSVLENEYGLTLTGWTLSTIMDISADGRTFVGHGTGPNGERAWVVTIPSPGGAGAFLALAVISIRRKRNNRLAALSSSEQ